MKAYREEGFPVTIVRPSLTYGETQSTLAINSWTKSYTAVDRMHRGKKLIVPGEGSSLWVISLPWGYQNLARRQSCCDQRRLRTLILGHLDSLVPSWH